MNEQIDDRWHRWLDRTAASFQYPPTPDVSKAVRGRLVDDAQAQPARVRYLRPAWVLVAVLILLGSLLLVPGVRASVLEILRAGGITIFVTEAPPIATEEPQTAASSPATASPASSPAAPLVPAQLVTLEEAQQYLGRPVALPSYPEDLGTPDQVYVDDEGSPPVVILVWLAPDQPQKVRLSLYYILARGFASKQAPIVETTTIDGQEAFWIEGPHYFAQEGATRSWQLVEGNVLVWWGEEITYRLEGASSLEQAERIAESLHNGDQ